MFGGAIAAAALPLGALARPRQCAFGPLTKYNSSVEVRFTDEMLTWEEFMFNPTVRQIAEQLDGMMYRPSGRQL